MIIKKDVKHIKDRLHHNAEKYQFQHRYIDY